jgi:hypothetical protein
VAQTAIDAARSSAMLNANLPVGTSGAPGTQLAALTASAMKLKLTSTASTGSASGTELTGTGYTAGGTVMPGASTASSSGSNVTLPHTAAISWTNGSGGNWTIVSLELQDNNATTRVWYGNWNGQPITVANGNTFQVAADAISAGGF